MRKYWQSPGLKHDQDRQNIQSGLNIHAQNRGESSNIRVFNLLSHNHRNPEY